MLVLSRNVDEAIMIGAQVCVRVLKIRGKQVQLGIVAPKDIKILREEVTTREKPVIENRV